MRRRKFLHASGLAALGALAGCIGSKSPPPRRSSVVSDFEMNNGKLVIDLADETWVTSRYEPNQQSLSGVSPIGVASAKGKGGGGGRGATGRGSGGYSTAPRTVHGHAWYHGGDYADDWYEDNRGKFDRYKVGIAALGIAYLGGTSQMRDDTPDAGPVPWDETIQNPDETVTYDITDRSEFRRDGWYRVGANIVGDNVNHDFRWECFDLEVDKDTQGFDIEEQWKVSPRI
ncbi:hypothetical protein C453_19265 [Haloferax elongans ATCC BAA-1513]|uniref:Lipoprotein n=1 Tax=Haloferax elongans ATCC BAA-1513 TaxID=1230453 RepID=M0HAV6_HALEO|nr:hypothetical protein [Haloferax elongans]ELZ80249.1 hypothetical protein C453_19265 [Haloferax elongans ATCC BAA-1513]